MSILETVRQAVGLEVDDDTFDSELIPYVNTALNKANSLGVGDKVVTIHDDTTEWSELIGDDDRLEIVKTYVGLKVKMMFVPPESQILIDVTNRMIEEHEWDILRILELEG